MVVVACCCCWSCCLLLLLELLLVVVVVGVAACCCCCWSCCLLLLLELLLVVVVGVAACCCCCWSCCLLWSLRKFSSTSLPQHQDMEEDSDNEDEGAMPPPPSYTQLPPIPHLVPSTPRPPVIKMDQVVIKKGYDPKGVFFCILLIHCDLCATMLYNAIKYNEIQCNAIQ